jgi:predicted dehydrogenase
MDSNLPATGRRKRRAAEPDMDFACEVVAVSEGVSMKNHAQSDVLVPPVQVELPSQTVKPARRGRTQTIRLAAIGFGSRISHICALLCRIDPQIRVAAAMDPHIEQSKQWAREREIPDSDRIHFFDDFESLLARGGDFDGFLIGSPDHLHTPMAVQLAALNKPLYLEKPVCISWEQYRELQSAWFGRESEVLISFPLRLTKHVRVASELIRAGRLGTINQIQAVNNVSYGGVFFGQWFRDYEQTGGLWLQKATHDFDYITQLMGALPLHVTAMHSRRIYGGEMAPDMRCSACDRTETCKESPINLTRRGDDGGTLSFQKPTPDADHACCFSSSIKNQDAGSAIIMYESGLHAAYSQNFLSRRSAGVRGATVIGYDATLNFSWQSKTLRIIEHHRDHVDELSVEATGGHGGGDEELASNFIEVMRGRAASRSPLNEGLLSAAMCLSARESAATGAAMSIPSFSEVDASKPQRRGAVEIEPITDRRST